MNTGIRWPARTLGLVAAMLSIAMVSTGEAKSRPRYSNPSVATNSSLPGGQVSVNYSTTFSASGGVAPYAWSVVSGSLAPGLILGSASGALGGIPSSAGNFSFTIQVQDSAGRTGQKSFTLAIAAAPAPAQLAIQTATLPAGAQNQAYSASLQATGGTAPFTWSLSAGQLPAGLSLSSAGQVSGTPSATGLASFTVQVTDAAATRQSATAALTLTVSGTAVLDQYGGRTDRKCASATGWFHTEKISGRWWFCTPLGNAFFLSSVYNVTPVDQTDDRGNDYHTVVGKKYPGGEPEWAEATTQRLQSWGFNAIGPFSSTYVLPFSTDPSYPVDSNGLHSIPTKLPFLMLVRPGYYAMRNSAVYLSNYTNAPLLPQPVKNMLYGASPYYTGYTPYDGEADYYDTNIYTWLQKDLTTDMTWSQIKHSPYLPYLVGISTEDSDDTFGFGAGDAFATSPAGQNSPNLAWLVAVNSPVQAADAQYQHVYSDTTVYTKKAWRDYLAAKYGTIGALDAAWGASYTTFDSSGSSISGEQVGAGDGGTVSFSHTLAQLQPSKYSVQVLVGGVAMGGDTGNGVVYGPQLSGTINYATGALTVTFTAAPALGAAITVNYVANGWGIGTGLLDEDGRPADQAWLGTDAVYLANTKASMKTDLDGFLGQVAGEYFGNCRSQIKSVFANILYLGPTTLGTWSAPSRAAVLQAAGQYVDAMSLGGEATLTPAMMDYVAQNFGDKPYFTGVYLTANPDSALNAYPQTSVGSTLVTQAARGQAYQGLVSGIQTTATSAGTYPYVGTIWWQFVDSWGEKLNWGLVTNLDNAYDGHEAVRTRAGVGRPIACSPPLTKRRCGGELRNYGNAIALIKRGNRYWLDH